MKNAHKNRIIGLLIISSLIFITSCYKNKDWEYTEGHFTTTPVNLSFLNTGFDDYNSALNQSGETFPLCFSSNRKSSGWNYDIVYKFVTIIYDWESKKQEVKESDYGSSYMEMQSNSISNALQKINSPNDEFGPFILFLGSKPNPGNQYFGEYYSTVFLYSNDESGNQDIRFVENQNQESYSNSKPIRFLNTPFDDAYPSFNQKDSGLYFCSNRDGSFNIFFAKIDFGSQDWASIFSDTSQKAIQKIDILSSDSADKCPFILGNTLVFTSNRAGGYGGYDLYYSKFENGSWSAPVNFGPQINTAADEYRPVVRHEEGFDNDFMIFSSNRAGGQGGFDLYYVGIPKIKY